MAAGGADDLVVKFQEFCTLAGSKDKTDDVKGQRKTRSRLSR